MQREIKKTWFFKQAPEEVWEYLTKPELLGQWLGETDFKPEVGHHFHFTSPYGNHSYCEVLEVSPFTRLSFSWQKNSLTDGKPYRSKVAWTLEPSGSGTELRLVHNGFAWLEDLEGHDKGWGECIEQFSKLINRIKDDSTIA
jgi:uncharacterized protein YndB with AHSA1/START domain